MASKYGSKKVEKEGHIFDSKIEARYYEQLNGWKQINRFYFIDCSQDICSRKHLKRMAGSLGK
jgi:hypothetical protein